MVLMAFCWSDLAPAQNTVLDPAGTSLADNSAARTIDGPHPKDLMNWIPRVWSSYPPEARRNGHTGKIGIRVIVQTNGRVESCEIASSSGHAILDHAACDAFSKHARFTPATNAAGERVAAPYETTVSYN